MEDKNFKKLIDDISKALKQKYSDFKGVYFYGSRVRGDFNEDSDYDVVFVFDRDEIDWRFKKDVKYLIYENELKYEVFLDSRVYTLNDIKNPKSLFRYNVNSEGIFYGA